MRSRVIVLPILIFVLLLANAIQAAEEAIEQVQPPSVEDAVIEESCPGTLKEADAITDIESYREGNFLKIILTANGVIPDYEAFPLDEPTRLVIDFFSITKTSLAKRIRTINSPYIERIRIGIHPDKVRVCLDSSEEGLPPHRVLHDHDRLVIVMGEAGSKDTRGEDERPKVILAGIVKSKVLRRHMLEADEAKGDVEIQTPEPEDQPIKLPGNPETYTERKVSLDFRDADIHHVFRVISNLSGLNIEVGDEVKGTVTMRMTDVPEDQALDLDLATHGLTAVREGNVIQIAPSQTQTVGVSDEAEGYRLSQDDIIKLSIFARGEMQTQVELAVSSNGLIICPFLGDVKAQGLTVSQLAERIRGPLARDYFVEPQVFISLKECKSPDWNVYVMGKVKEPGAYEFKHGLTALDACILAGGFDDFAAPNRATITRRENGENKLIKINLNKVKEGGEEDTALRPGDRINIPESRI